MLFADEFEPFRARVAASPDLSALADRLRGRAAPVLDRMPVVPPHKALLSKDGGLCPADGTVLRFDPWEPDAHTCPTCGAVHRGIRHDRHWARSQHLWLAERAAHLATVGVVLEDDECAERAKEIVLAYPELYFSLPNRDNVLGPTRLFFSTYLESMWLLNYLSAAMLLREGGILSERDAERAGAVVEESSAMIGEFNEGMSNRQTWHAAALTAVAVWFEDEDLARTTIEGRTGLLGHLTDGFGDDGLWFEGENYHLFALRGLMTGLEWARAAGADLLEDPRLAGLLGEALLAPTRTALPDATYPARKDARYGVSLAQPVHLELWEAGREWLSDVRPSLDRWLDRLYALPVPPSHANDSYLHEVGEQPPAARTRADLSWWALLTMSPDREAIEEEAPEEAAEDGGRLFTTSGLALVRDADRYVSLECASTDLGHGHPDRLHLTVHAGGVHWLPDPGAGSYVSRDLFWYRSTLAHNAPLLEGSSQEPETTWCSAFAQQGSVGWMRGRWGEVTRTVVTGSGWVADRLDLEVGGEDPRVLMLPWHLQGALTVDSSGTWEPDAVGSEFVSLVERFVPEAGEDPIVITAAHETGRHLRVWLLPGGADLLRATGPGLPGGPPVPFLLVRSAAGLAARQVAVLDLAPDGPEAITSVAENGGSLTLSHTSGTVTIVQAQDQQATVTSNGQTVTLAGTLPAPKVRSSLFTERPAWDLPAVAHHVAPTPNLDGTLEGFVVDDPLTLEGEVHYRRSEDPYEGPEQISATAYLNWDADALYLAVEVAKPEVIVRGDDAPPLKLDNEPDDVHGDGIQVYLRLPDQAEAGYLIALSEGGRIRARHVGGPATDQVQGAWAPLDGPDDGRTGYLLTARVAEPRLGELPPDATVDFDLIVNEAQPDRERRAGQLVFAGGGGWVYLRGDRHGGAEWGSLALR